VNSREIFASSIVTVGASRCDDIYSAPKALALILAWGIASGTRLSR
jgi:hypothetical protein